MGWLTLPFLNAKIVNYVYIYLTQVSKFYVTLTQLIETGQVQVEHTQLMFCLFYVCFVSCLLSI